MIKSQCTSPAWIEQVAKSTNAKDKTLVETVIRALMLLEGLAKSDLKFVFKGGTALMLLFDSARRLSVDIDIIVQDKEAVLDDTLQQVCKNYGFTRYEEQKRTSPTKINKAHYILFFPSVIAGTESCVLLDVLKEQIHYHNVIEIPIKSPFVELDSVPIEVRIPDFNNILGDKLTAFAPNTTGIPYRKGDREMGMEIVKQMYDIGCLFDRVDSIEAVSIVFEAFAKTELSYREDNGECAVTDVLNDIIDHSLAICFQRNYGKADFDILSTGVVHVRNFIFSESFNQIKAITYAAKVAYLAAAIKNGKKELLKFVPTSVSEMKDWLIQDPPLNKLNKLKKSNPEAFFYLYRMSEFALQR